MNDLSPSVRPRLRELIDGHRRWGNTATFPMQWIDHAGTARFSSSRRCWTQPIAYMYGGKVTVLDTPALGESWGW